MIACIRIPYFAASLERQADPSLEGVPLVLVEPDGVSPAVEALSEEAEGTGVHQGMTLQQARAVCTQAYVAPANLIHYRRVLAETLENLATLTPLVEAVQPRTSDARHLAPVIDGDGQSAIYVVDLETPQLDPALEMAKSLGEMLQDSLRLPLTIAVANGRFPAQIAASSLAVGEVSGLQPGEEARFVAPYPVTLLPIYTEQVRQLSLLGIRTLGDLAGLPTSALLTLFGKQGRWLHQLAQGRDNRPVQPYVPPITDTALQQFESATEDRLTVEHALQTLVAGLAARLEKHGQVARQVGLTVVQDDSKEHLAELILRQPTGSGQRLVDTLTEMLRGMHLTQGVVEVEVLLGDIAQAEAQQLSLFEIAGAPREDLRSILEDLVRKYGSESFYWASLTSPDDRLPERRFKRHRLHEE